METESALHCRRENRRHEINFSRDGNTKESGEASGGEDAAAGGRAVVRLMSGGGIKTPVSEYSRREAGSPCSDGERDGTKNRKRGGETGKGTGTTDGTDSESLSLLVPPRRSRLAVSLCCSPVFGDDVINLIYIRACFRRTAVPLFGAHLVSVCARMRAEIRGYTRVHVRACG